MTTALDSNNPTLSDIVKTQDPDGAPAKIVEALRKRCPVLDYMTFQQGNLETGHRVTTETMLPSVGYRAFNEGVESGMFTAGQFDEVTGLMEGRSVLDTKLAALNGNTMAYRAQHDMRFLRAFKYEFETGFFYNSTATSTKKFNGLAPRYNGLATAGPSKNQVIDAGMSPSGSDQTSVWLVCFSPETVFGITPKGQPAGLVSEDMGKQMITDAAGNRFSAYETIWNWSVGVCVADAESVVRVCNIDTSSIVGTGHLLLDAMETAFFRLRDPSMGRCVWFGNRTVAEYLHKQAQDRVANSTLSIQEDYITHKTMTHFQGFPFVVSDQILNTEAVIT